MRLVLLTLALSAALAAGAAASPDSLGTAARDPGAPAQAPAAPPPPAAAPGAPDLTVHAIRLEGPIVLDGVLSEPVWQTGVPVTRFTQRDPVEGAPATERTEVRVAYDDEAIY